MNEDHERIEMIGDFVTESRELLEEIEPQIIAMEEHVTDAGVVDQDILNSIFRLFHSIKGMASFLDLQTVINVTHEAETLLDLFRKGQSSLQTRHIELLYNTSDFMKGLLDTIEQQLSDGGVEVEGQALGIIGELQKSIETIVGGTQPTGTGSQGGGITLENSTELGTGREEYPAEVLAQELATGKEPVAEVNTLDWIFTVTPEMVQRFVMEGQEILEEAETALLQLESQGDNPELLEQVLRAFHSFKGNAGFLGYGQMESLSHRAENLLSELQERTQGVCHRSISSLLQVLDAQRHALGCLAKGEEPQVANLDQLLTKLDQLFDRLANQEDPTPSSSGEQVPGSLAVPNQELSSEPSGEGPNGKKTTTQQAIRVDVEKLDSLLDLVGEMVIAVAMVSHNPDLQGLQMDRFDKAIRQLNKITREIQDVSMSMRMVPLAGIFRKMIRVVRDVSYKLNKKVNLEIIGEETEVDKTIIEQISDPLVHIIRNAVDHGLEHPEKRLAAGKSEVGRITLEARHAAGEVWIVIRDDGRGLDREKILARAKDRGLLAEDHGDLKDEEVWKFIFEPGLSTAQEVSSISGRGVGMDVVKQNIDKLRGRIEIRSTPGQGTLIVIRIPLTLAIIEGMVVQVGTAMYTIPIVAIKECFQPRQGQLTLTPEGLEVVSIRGELLPIVRLHEVYRSQPRYHRLADGILIVVESEEQKCCLFVDELVGQQQIVIKALPPSLGQIRGVSGLAILGDGEVSTILDVAQLMQSVEELLETAKNLDKSEVAP